MIMIEEMSVRLGIGSVRRIKKGRASRASFAPAQGVQPRARLL
jgi:hypothetical protein